MSSPETIYQSILLRLSTIPVEHLREIDDYLTLFANNLSHPSPTVRNKRNTIKKFQSLSQKQANAQKVVSLVGSFNDMKETDFQEYLQASKKAGNDLFNREFEL